MLDEAADILATSQILRPLFPQHIPSNRSLRRQASTNLQREMRASDHQKGHSSRPRSFSTRSAFLSLDIIVVGAGIGGLAAAYALTQAGHRVRVLERSPSVEQRAGGIRVPPNLSKILMEWGLEEQLYKVAQRCYRSAFYDLESAEPIGCLEFKEDVIRETGADFLLVHHSDLHHMIHDLAVSVGVSITLSASVTSISTPAPEDKSQRPRVSLKGGETLTADLVVGADGFNSTVRPYVVENESSYDTKMSILTMTVPTEKMRADPELAILLERPEWPMWMGTSRSLLGYPIRQGLEYCLHLFWPDEDIVPEGQARSADGPDQHDTSKPNGDGAPPAPPREDWDGVIPTECLRLGSSHPLVQRLVRLAPDAIRTKFIRREAFDDWADPTNRVLLLGEAAHPIMPCGVYGCSLAVEDAAVLGVLFSRLRTHDQLPSLIEAYQELRQPRCTYVANSEFNNAALVWLPPGPERDQRNLGMKATLQLGKEHWDEGKLRDQWEQIGGVFGYSAREAAEGWWVSWGALRESAGGVGGVWDRLDLRFEVTEEVEGGYGNVHAQEKSEL